MTTVKEAGKKGGSVKSPAKAKAAKANASKPRGKWITAIHAEWYDKAGVEHSDLVIVRGQFEDHDLQALIGVLEKHSMAMKFPIEGLRTLTAVSERFVL